MSRKRLSNSSLSEDGSANSPVLDVGDVPIKLLELQYYAQQIQQRSSDPEIQQLGRQIEEGLDPCISAMANAVEQLAELPEVA